MKKFIWTLIVLTLAAVSCSKDTPKTDNKDWSRFDSSKYLVSFTGTLEQTKVAVDLSSGALAWEDGDKVLVCVAGSGQTGQYQYNADGKFYPVDESNLVELPDGGTAYMYYPAGAFTISGENATLKMPAAVTGAEDLGDKNPMAATFVQGTDESAGFKNICALFRVQLTGSRTVSSVELSNDDVPIAAESEYTVGWADGIPSVSSSASGKSMAISGNYPLDETSPTEFCFLLPPTAASMSGMAVTVTLTTADAGGKTTVELTRQEALSISRNHMMRIAFYAGLFSGGNGTEADPYKIANARDFNNIANYTQNGYGSLTTDHFFGAHYIQIADIDFSGVAVKKIGEYISVRDFSQAFTGVYDGGGKTLSNYEIKEPTVQGLGLFCATNNALFKNVVLSGITVQGKSYVGGLVGLAATSTFKDCIIGGTVQSNGGATGGMVGYLYQGATITGCYARNLSVGPIDTTTGNNFGGIVGYIPNNGTIVISDCHAEASSTISSGVNGHAGGILGSSAMETFENATLSDCTNAATINCGLQRAGGIAGGFVNGTIKNCVNNGPVTLNGTGNSAGGIVGYIKNGLVESCINNATVKSNKTYAGGVVGYIQAQVTVTKCINTGTVDGTNSNTGGIVGYAYSKPTISLCYCKAPFVKGSARVGGIVGHINGADAWVIDCVADTDVISTSKATATDDGKNGAVGGIVGTLTNGTLANCVHRGHTVILRNSGNDADSQALSCIGGIIGHARGGNILNCITYATCDQLGAGAEGTTVTMPSTDAASVYMGLIYGHNEAGTIKDCYALNNATAGYSVGTNAGTLSNATIFGGGEAQGYFNHTYNSLVTAPDGTTATSLTLSDGTTSYAVTGTYPVSILNGGAALIGYTGSESLTWEEVSALDNNPLPSALVALGAEYYQ